MYLQKVYSEFFAFGAFGWIAMLVLFIAAITVTKKQANNGNFFATLIAGSFTMMIVLFTITGLSLYLGSKVNKAKGRADTKIEFERDKLGK